jgi:dynactin 1
MPHINDIRSSKAPFQLAKVMQLVKETANSTVGPAGADTSGQNANPWDLINKFIEHLIDEGARLQPLMMENENIVKGWYLFVFLP